MVRSARGGFTRTLAVLFGLYALAGGAISFLGWAADWPRLTDWLSDGISIQPNAALAALIAGAGIVLIGVRLWRAALAIGAIVFGIGATVIIQYASGISLGIDAMFLFGRTWGDAGVLFPGRMGPPGAVSWTLLGSAIALVASSDGELGVRRAIAAALAVVSAGIATLSLTGYAYGADALYAVPTATAIALQTSTFVLAVSLGLILSVPERGLVRLLRDDGPAGLLARRALPVLIVVPIALGYLRLWGDRAGWFDPAFASAARGLLEVVCLLALLWWTVRAVYAHSEGLRSAEAARERSEEALRQSRAELEMDLSDSRRLQQVSAEIIHENDDQALYDKIVAAAQEIMRSQCASLQVLDPSRDELQLLAHRGFDATAAGFWAWVDAGSHATCGMALRSGHRTAIVDVSACEALTGTDDLAMYQRTGIRAVQSTPLRSRSGAVLGMISTHWDRPHEASERDFRVFDLLVRQAADLIDRRRAESALLEADRRKDAFVATLAHELRNPLAPIRSAIDLMKIKQTEVPEIAWARDVIDRQVDLMARLLDDLLDVSRIARDKLVLRKEIVDLRSAIHAAVEQCRPLLTRFDHELQLDLPDDPVDLNADPVRLAQIFGNLLHNACKYTPRKGRITVTVARDGDRTAVVTVQDTGIGIPSEKLATMFGLFAEGGPPPDHSQTGLGIGLYLVKRLVEMHGGRVEARSEGRGHGSVFVVHLPVEPAFIHLVRTAPAAPPEALALPAPSRRILIVDDNTDAAASLARLLELGGNVIHVAHDGHEAVQAAQWFQPDVVLLDIGLPRMNGFDACRHIRAQPWAKDVIMIALSGWGQDVDRRKSEDAGFHHHLVKPVERTALTGLLGSLTSKVG